MKYDHEKYKVYTWKNGLMLHWVLNPGLAISELVLGQRVPKISLLDKTTVKPRAERSFVPCPHCEKLHDSRTWATQNGTAFKNWFGLYCANCGKIIPCLTNWLSFVVLALTYPIWGWFKKRLKANWLAKQPARYDQIDLEIKPNPFDEKSWVKTGLTWGVLMFVFMTFLTPLLLNAPVTWKTVGKGIIVWTIAGLMFGFIMKLIMQQKGKASTPENG